jgi:hypothetical protein
MPSTDEAFGPGDVVPGLFYRTYHLSGPRLTLIRTRDGNVRASVEPQHRAG